MIYFLISSFFFFFSKKKINFLDNNYRNVRGPDGTLACMNEHGITFWIEEKVPIFNILFSLLSFKALT